MKTALEQIIEEITISNNIGNKLSELYQKIENEEIPKVRLNKEELKDIQSKISEVVLFLNELEQGLEKEKNAEIMNLTGFQK